VTHRAKTIARIVPEEPPAKKADFDSDVYRAEVDRIGAELAKKWPKGLTAAQAIGEDRSRLE
jgi:hypothetical protein